MSYWIGLICGDVRYFGSRRRWVALVRVLWRTIIHADNGERCGVCGRAYVLWMAPDYLYRDVVGNLGGQLCPACLTDEAAVKGMTLIWSPSSLGCRDDALNEFAKDIGAFQ